MITEEYLRENYIKQDKSIPQMAEELNTYPNKIRRAIIKYGFPIRDRSEAQSHAIKNKRHPHPTKGKKHSEKTKNQIAAAVSEVWEDLSSADKKERSEKARNNWNKKSFEEQQSFLSAAYEGVRRAAKEGSKLEKFIQDLLIGAGYVIECHKNDILDDGMHIDIFIPKIKTAIEIDGPAHFLPIWGEDKLKKHRARDRKKNGIILAANLNLLRIKNTTQSLSNYRMQLAGKEILSALEEMINNQKITGQFVEIEV